MTGRAYWTLLRGSVAIVALAGSVGAWAQTAPGSAGDAAGDGRLASSAADEGIADIVVTARKRSETAMQTPVIMSVLSSEQLQTLNIKTIDDIGEVTPGLKVQRGFGGAVGSVVNVRGISSGTSAVYIDQSVGFAVDSVGFSHGSFYDAAVFDLGQVELLKGPQGLFFGKSTTAGLVSFTTADPTPRLEAGLTGAYEFNADEFILNGYVSAPLTDQIGIRVAGFRSSMRGFLYNQNPNSTPAQRRIPDGDAYGGRLTLKADTGKFRARLKVSATHSYSHGEQQSMRQFLNCTLGSRPQNSFFAYDNCQLDDNNIGVSAFPRYNPDVDWINSSGNAAAFATGSPFPETGDGSGYLRKKSLLATFQGDYDLATGLTLTTVLGYGRIRTDVQQQGFIASLGVYQLINHWHADDYSAEVRLTSDWKDKWFNFMIGGLIAPGTSRSHQKIALPALTQWNQNIIDRDTRTASLFGQVLLTPIEKWEFSAGLRYSHIKQTIPYLYALTNKPGSRPGEPGAANYNQAPLLSTALTQYSEDNVSPEFTLTYRPTQDLTVFGSYKFGYKGPGYNVSAFLATSYLANNILVPFGGEKVRGGEVGIKAVLFDRHVNFTAAAYHYKYIGLQVSHYDGTRGIVTVSNGADAVTKGIEIGANIRPSAIPGLRFDLFASYNDSRFSSFPNSPCYGGQTVATGCRIIRTGVTAQDLSGARLAYAPQWTSSLGVTYETDLGSHYRLVLNGRADISSRYNFTPARSPNGYQPGYATFDASIRVGPQSEAWDVSLIGRNLTDKRYVATGFDAGAITPGVVSDVQGITNRPRQIMLQISLRPDLL